MHFLSEYGGGWDGFGFRAGRSQNQWRNAQSVYNEVSDPALIDAVIYQVMAAERRYEYLLRLAKSESLSCENIPIR